MNRVLAAIPCLVLAADLSACGASSTKSAAATVTTTVTVTATPTASDPSSDPSDGSAGASDPSSAAAVSDSGPDACSLLTQAQANSVASTPLMKGTGAGKNAAGAFVMCQYVGQPNGPTAELEVYDGDGAKQQLHIDRDNLQHKFTEIPGVGDQCLQEDGFIFVQKNGLWASIHLVRLNDAAQNVQPMRTGITELAAKLP